MKTFDNVAKLKLATLTTGQFVETGGYYTKGGGGAAKYLIVAPQAADGYGDHVLANGNVAKLTCTENTVNVRQYGAKGDGVTDDSDSFEAAWFAATTFEISQYDKITRGMFMPKGVYIVSKNHFLNDTGQGVELGRRFIWFGEGTGLTVFIFRPTVPDAYMYDQQAAPNPVFQGLELRDFAIRFKDENNAGAPIHGFRCDSVSGQATQNFSFNNIFATLRPDSVWWRSNGNVNDDLNDYHNCRFQFLKTLIYLDNAESVVHNLTNTDIELLYGHAFVNPSGGDISMVNGSIITDGNATEECGLLYLAGSTGGANAGGYITFNNVRMEMRSSLSRVLYMTNSQARQLVSFKNCGFGNTSFQKPFAKIPVANHARVVFEDCTLPQDNLNTLEFVDNSSPLNESAQLNQLNSVVKFRNCKRFGGSDLEQSFYTDWNQLTGSETLRGQVVTYEGCEGLPDTQEYGNLYGTGKSYSPRAGSLAQFRGLTFPYTSDGVNPSEKADWPNIEVPWNGFISKISVIKSAQASGGIPYQFELVDQAEYDTPGAGTIYATSPSQNYNTEWDWNPIIGKRFTGTKADRTIWLVQKPSTYAAGLPQNRTNVGMVYATII